MENEVLLKVNGLCKIFGPVKALTDVSFEIRRGEIRGLIGENGSGKSTASSIIAGIQPADRGEMFCRGEKYQPSSMIEAQSRGISMVVQEMGTIGDISVAENIFTGKETQFRKGLVVSKKRMNAEAAKILNEIGANHIAPGMPTGMLNLEDRKLVEIARAMYAKPDLFIVDETTTALSHHGREIVYNLMKKMQSEQKAVLFISHDLDELMQVCNVLTVLRDGVLIDSLTSEQFEPGLIKKLMVGRTMSEKYYRDDLDGSTGEKVVLSVDHIMTGDVLIDVSFDLHEGEILGVGGLSGSGIHELGRAVFGADKIYKGSVIAGGKKIDSSETAIRQNIGYVSKNRDEEALMVAASIKDNITLASIPELSRHYFVWPAAEKKFTQAQIDSLSIKCSSMEQDIRYLSGGNKQKVSFGKWIGKNSDILVLDCPTRGVDIGVKAAMYELMYELKKQGKSIIMISEELPELIGMSDNVIILRDGKLSASFKREDLDESLIIEHMI